MRFGPRVVCALVVVLLGSAFTASADDERLDGYRLVRVVVSSWEQIESLHGLGALLMSEGEGIGSIDYLIPPESMAALDMLDVPYKVMQEDIQRLIDAERQRLLSAPPVEPRDPAWFTDYKNFAQTVAKMQAMATDRPDLCTLIDIGNSYEGRDIWCMRISGPGLGKPAVLFNGLQHAREWISPMVNMWIADRLVYEYDTNPEIRSIMDRVEFFIIPIVNPDGYEYTWNSYRLWRKSRRVNDGTTCRGVDLNRNWGVGWGGGGSSGDPCSDTYRGTAPFSEPETQAIANFFLTHPQVVSTIDFHSYSQLILSPYGYTGALPPDHDVFMELGEAMHDEILAVHGQQYAWGPIYGTLYQASGGSVDWCYDVAGAFAYTIELRDTGWYGFELPPAQIIPTAQENFEAAMYLAEWSASPVKFSFPNGHPTRLVPDEPTTMLVKIRAIGAALDPTSLRLYARVGTAGAFSSYALTSLGNNTYEATLPPTPCGRTLQYYFAAGVVGGSTYTAPADAPATTFEVTAAPIVIVFQENMNTNPGWTTEDQWAWGQPTGGGGQYGGPDPTSGVTGPYVYGYNLAGDYANNLPERHLTTPPFNCTGLTGVKLGFWRWLGVERSTYDHAYIRVSNNGVTWTTIWSNPDSETADTAWSYHEFDISQVADNQPAVRLRWTMGTTDSSWRYCGWNIDDVQVWAADADGCPNVTGDMDCDGDVDFDDIDPFVKALEGQAAYEAEYPNCDWYNGDIDGDGDVDFDDIDGFVALLS